MRLAAALPFLPLIAAAPWASKRSAPAPLLLAKVQTSDNAGKYIVKFKEDLANRQAVDHAMSIFPHDADHVFEHVFPGFAASLDKEALAALRDHPDVEYIEQDSTMYAAANVTQKNAVWNLSRISHKQITKPYEYVYDSAGATKGVCVYILDTGIDDTHPDFEGRAIQAKSTIKGETTDGSGHGTHVAGSVGSKTYGVAKGATLIGVKVLADSSGGTVSGILAGIDWTIADSKTRSCPKGALANMSLGGGFSQASNDAAAKFGQNGMFVSVAAGNENQDADNSSPASEPSVCTVGATNDQDKKWPSSNYGKSIDILAPGQDIKSTYLKHDYQIDSGTSMAAPHVAGMVAYLAAKDGQKPDGDWCEKLRQLATPDVITGFNEDTVNLLLYSGIGN